MLDPEKVFKFHITKSTCHISTCHVSNGHLQCFESEWTVPSDLPYLRGHFPSQPLLPAIAMIDGSLELLRSALGAKEIFPSAISSAKFIVPVTPDLKVKISLHQLSNESWQADWETKSSEGPPTLLAKIGFTISISASSGLRGQ
jgi:hypothetical protein